MKEEKEKEGGGVQERRSGWAEEREGDGEQGTVMVKGK
jgi:hypothetical protein